MGGVASIGQNNDELVEYLLDTGYIHKKEVELVFRVVDRADYILPSQQESTYKDLAWKHGNLHLSAPCVYGVAMEFLALRPGQSFLNIGSGTGYFSTMAGLLLGPYGINHGIELHEDCLQYARERLEHFKQDSAALEEFEFCEPAFVQGNCLRIESTKEYDAVYCGAAVPQNYIAAVKRFVRVGGIIVVPYKGRLCCFTRVSESGWSCRKALGVSFATLIIPDPSDQSIISLPDSEPLSLQELCRSKVRQILRQRIWIDYPELKKRNLSTLHRQPRPVSSLDESDDWVSNEDEEEDEEEDDDDDDDDEDVDNDEEDLTEGVDLIGPTRFMFNMDVDSNDPTSNPLHLRRVAMLVQQRNAPEEQCGNRSGTLERITEERRSGGVETAGGDSPEENATAGASFALDLTLSESPERNGGRAARDRVRRSEERRARREKESDTDSDTDSESEKEAPKTPAGFRRLWCPPREELDDTSSSVNPEPSYFDTDEGMDVDISSVAVRETFQRVWGGRAENLTANSQQSGENAPVVSNAVDSRLFINCMKEKIRLLPLPTTLKLYINHNRSL